MKIFGGVLALVVATATPAFTQTPESEPNSSFGTADRVQLGARASGAIDADQPGSAGNDPDIWVFAAHAGDVLQFEVNSVFSAPGLQLYATDTTTRLFDNYGEGGHLVMRYTVTADGDYYLRVSNGNPGGGRDAYYVIGLWTDKQPRPACAVGQDGEPNDTTATAHVLTLGATVDGVFCPTHDWDVFKLALTARTRIQIDVRWSNPPAPQVWGAPRLGLGNDKFSFLEWDWRGNHPVEYWVPEDRDFFVTLLPLGGVTDTRYQLVVRSLGAIPPGRGDPVTLRADAFDSPMGVAAGPDGNLYVADHRSGVWRVTPGGVKSKFAQVAFPVALAFDQKGDLLVGTVLDGVVRITPQGTVSQFATGMTQVSGVAVAGDTTVWVTDPWEHTLLHFSASGSLLERRDVSSFHAGHQPSGVGVGPDGNVYFSTGPVIFRLTSSSAVAVVKDSSSWGWMGDFMSMGQFAFDVNGNIYVGNRHQSAVHIYDKNGTRLETALAMVQGTPLAVTFGRNSDGSMNSRLYVAIGAPAYGSTPAVQFGKLVELNSTAARAPGFGIGGNASADVSVAAAVSELLRPGALTTAQLQQLDQRGNNNGRYDVGDLRAYLIRSGTLAASPVRKP